ncbi:DUF2804 domain-containing protein [Paucisalibacillus globulus]|jgi:Protein of unknown function (DUF2804)|uniref:DUF2804 domain-containing protein n=1 Tax=Paucisalibacillus globulus TaxID=351095 RepID=UPI000BB98D91|nr:DUF2804 domain-containing protein [Paucisalibacillus globulus]
MKPGEITSLTKLSLQSGLLNEESIGWARKPYIISNVKGSFLRKKKWNYWCVTTPEVLFSATISHIDYAAVMFVYILDLKTLQFHEKTTLVPLGKKITMPEGVQESVSYESKGMTIRFKDSGQVTTITVHCPNFSGDGQSLEADLVLTRPEDYESLNVVVPWSNKRYQFTSKQPAIPATGRITWRNKQFQLQENDAFGCLDFGRGKWNYQSTWNWASASGVVEGKRVGLNFGGQWTDGTGQNENGILVGDKLHKIHEDITWEYDTNNYMKPWKLYTKETKRVSLEFTPLFERIATTNVVIIKSSVHQMIGHFNGSITTDQGEKVEIQNMLGWAEDHMARW